MVDLGEARIFTSVFFSAREDSWKRLPVVVRIGDSIDLLLNTLCVTIDFSGWFTCA